jgi:sugar/nucleoside kinase (ribokinase family)
MHDIAFVGHFTKDTIHSAAGTRIVPGGAFNYGAHAARALGLATAAITRMAAEDRAVVEELRGIGVQVFLTETPRSTCLSIEFPSPDPDERVMRITSSAGAFTPEELKEVSARAFVIGPSLRGEVSPAVIAALMARDPPPIIAADVQGFIRTEEDGRIRYSRWPERAEVMGMTTILKTDSVEAEFLTGSSDRREAARALASEGPREVVLTHRDGVLVYDGGAYYEAPFLPQSLVGRSGRGDTCIAAYVAARLSLPATEATLWAAALTSLKLEAEGPFRGNRSMVETCIAERYR